MVVHREINQLPHFKNSVITIGTFDGVHLGHLQVIKLLKQESSAVNGESVIITFHPHPRMIVNKSANNSPGPTGSMPAEKPIGLLNTLDEKIELIAAHGIDHLVIVPFTERFALLTAEEYIRDFLVEKFKPFTIVIGHDHRFGKHRSGSYELLELNAANLNYTVKEIPKHLVENVAISSTIIRKAILQADIKTANTYLGYPFFFEGTVVEGDKIGRNLGYPTANLVLTDENKILPANGVYAVRVSLPATGDSPGINSLIPGTTPGSANTGRIWNGMMNIGVRPTIGGEKKLTEVNIFDFQEDIYGERARVFVHEYLRPEKKFDGLDALKAQLAIDKTNARDILARYNQ